MLDRRSLADGIQYSGKENPNLESEIDGNLKEFMHLIDERYISDGAKSRPANFGEITADFTLDTLTKIAYGKELEWMAAHEDLYNWIKITTGLIPLTVFGAAVPTAGVILDVLRRISAPNPNDKKGVGRLMG